MSEPAENTRKTHFDHLYRRGAISAEQRDKGNAILLEISRVRETCAALGARAVIIKAQGNVSVTQLRLLMGELEVLRETVERLRKLSP